jgi:hypothetical protein
MRAKQNALLALNVAIGELQVAAGPDQRVTARADMHDSTPSTLADEGITNPFWLGVYRTVESGSETQSLENLRTWATDRSAASICGDAIPVKEWFTSPACR